MTIKEVFYQGSTFLLTSSSSRMSPIVCYFLILSIFAPSQAYESWVLGPQGSGDCHATCSNVNQRCDESMGQAAALNSRIRLRLVEEIICQGWNTWNYGQGFSKCTDPTCCNDGSCQNHCSSTSSWPGCKIDDGFAYGGHSRICPCNDIAECPDDGWTEYAGKCYKFFGNKTSWRDAEKTCLKNDGWLASIKDKETNDFITGTLLQHIPDNTPYHQVYIGGQQIKEGGYTRDHWEWSDGGQGGRTEFGYTNWMANPADGGNEDCMSMLLKNDASNVRGKWNDVNCDIDNWLPFICTFDSDNKPFPVVIFSG